MPDLSVGSPFCSSSSPVQAALEKLLFSQPLLTGDYHYSGKPLTWPLTWPLTPDLNDHGWFFFVQTSVDLGYLYPSHRDSVGGTAWYVSLEQTVAVALKLILPELQGITWFTAQAWVTWLWGRSHDLLVFAFIVSPSRRPSLCLCR